MAGPLRVPDPACVGDPLRGHRASRAAVGAVLICAGDYTPGP